MFPERAREHRQRFERPLKMLVGKPKGRERINRAELTERQKAFLKELVETGYVKANRWWVEITEEGRRQLERWAWQDRMAEPHDDSDDPSGNKQGWPEWRAKYGR